MARNTPRTLTLSSVKIFHAHRRDVTTQQDASVDDCNIQFPEMIHVPVVLAAGLSAGLLLVTGKPTNHHDDY
jgi:hypothetical protein